jgi:putative phosphoribosyl transferase
VGRVVGHEPAGVRESAVEIPADGVVLDGDLTVPPDAHGIVVFAHGSGSGRFSPRNRAVANVLVQAGLATLLMDLLTAEEDAVDLRTRHLRFDVGLLGRRVIATIEWLAADATVTALPVGCFGASTGAAAALIAAAERPERVAAVVSRGGRPDLAGEALFRVTAPTLLIVGGNDIEVLRLNQQALAALAGEARLEIVPGATHLFEEPGALERVAVLARDWFLRHLGGR